MKQTFYDQWMQFLTCSVVELQNQLVFHSDHSSTMLAGLGTLGLEILEQYGSKFDAILVPGNDKNLLTALRCSVKSIFPHVRIIVSTSFLIQFFFTQLQIFRIFARLCLTLLACFDLSGNSDQ